MQKCCMAGVRLLKAGKQKKKEHVKGMKSPSSVPQGSVSEPMVPKNFSSVHRFYKNARTEVHREPVPIPRMN